MKRIVILGGGFGGAYCAQALERRLGESDAEILLIDRNNYFVFYPLLVEAGTGSLEPRHAVVSIRSFLKRTIFRMAEVVELDPVRREVAFRPAEESETRRVPYDHLVVALGSVTRLPNVPGLERYGHGMKSLTDAVALRDRAIRMLERADATPDPEIRRALLHLVVVGGNFTGVEVAGEFHVFLRRACRHYRNVRPEDCQVTLIELAGRILSALDPDLSEYAVRQMRRRGMSVRLDSSVAEVRSDRVVLRNGDSIAAHTLIWCAGIEPNPLVRRLLLPADPRGYVLCEPDLRIRGLENAWAIGDCAVIPGPEGRPYPTTAQHAVREGIHLAKNLRRALRGERPRSFSYSSRGSIAPLGCRTGVAKVFGVKLSGFPAWFLWRSVYLLKMPGWSRRARVALDWTMDLLFAREYVQLGVHRNAERSAE